MRRLWVTSDRGLFWSMNCESWLDPKNSLTTADTGFALMSSWGISSSVSDRLSRSRTARSTRTSPMRNWFSAISPTLRMRRLPRWSMSSTCPRPFRISMRALSTSTMSCGESMRSPVESWRPSRRLNFIRPTAERS